eukprot:jgi/Tetstr1/427449/TSEL_001749.t1
MPAGPSSQISAATTRVSTQQQNLESEIKYLLKRATASEEAERCWREVVSWQKEVEKELREAESAGSSESSDSDEEGGAQKPGRERPAGLSYKVREATTRATVRTFIGRKAEQLEAWLTHAVGDDDSWLCMRRAGPAHSSEPLPAVTKERSSSSSSMAMSTRMELTGRRRASWRRRT